MKVDNNIMRQMSVGLDGVRNSNKAHQAEPDAFGQLFASMTQTSQTAQDGAVEAAPTAHTSTKAAKSTDEQGKTKAMDVGEMVEGDEGLPPDVEQANVETDTVGESAAGAAGVKVEREDVKESVAGGMRASVELLSGGKQQEVKEISLVESQDMQEEQAKQQKPMESADAPDEPLGMRQASQQQIVGGTAVQQDAHSQLQNATMVVQQEDELVTSYAGQIRKRGVQRETTGQIEVSEQATDAKPQAMEGKDSTRHSVQDSASSVVTQSTQTAVNSEPRMESGKAGTMSGVQVSAVEGASPASVMGASASVVPQAQQGRAMSSGLSLTGGNLTLTDADAERVAQQALGSVRSLAAPGSGQGAVTLRLNPPELGALRIVVRMDGPMLSATFEATNASVSTLLQSQMHSLRTALERAGLGVERLNVQLPSPLPSPGGANFGSAQQQMDQSPSDGRSRGWMGEGGRQSGGQQERQNQANTSSFQRELLDLVA